MTLSLPTCPSGYESPSARWPNQEVANLITSSRSGSTLWKGSLGQVSEMKLRFLRLGVICEANRSRRLCMDDQYLDKSCLVIAFLCRGNHTLIIHSLLMLKKWGKNCSSYCSTRRYQRCILIEILLQLLPYLEALYWPYYGDPSVLTTIDLIYAHFHRERKEKIFNSAL